MAAFAGVCLAIWIGVVPTWFKFEFAKIGGVAPPLATQAEVLELLQASATGHEAIPQDAHWLGAYSEAVTKRFMRLLLRSVQVRHNISLLVSLEILNCDAAVNNSLLRLVRFDPVQLGVGRQSKPSWFLKVLVTPFGSVMAKLNSTQGHNNTFAITRRGDTRNPLHERQPAGSQAAVARLFHQCQSRSQPHSPESEDCYCVFLNFFPDHSNRGSHPSPLGRHALKSG
eukprot:3266455-Amphidinium_carterae.1